MGKHCRPSRTREVPSILLAGAPVIMATRSGQLFVARAGAEGLALVTVSLPVPVPMPVVPAVVCGRTQGRQGCKRAARTPCCVRVGEPCNAHSRSYEVMSGVLYSILR